MQIQAFSVNPFGVNAFILWNDSGDGILIDPSVSSPAEQTQLVQFIKDKGIAVKRVVNTHLHLDHVLGNAFVERTFGVKAEAHEEDNFLLDLQEEQSEMYGLPFEEPAPELGNFLAEGDVVEVPGIKLHVLHIAGHSPGGIALYLPPEENAPSSVIPPPSNVIPTPNNVIPPPNNVIPSEARNPGILFSGDILFNGGRGRSDLFGGDDNALVSGIKNKLLTLPEDTVVLPGHGPSTTIGEEKAWF